MALALDAGITILVIFGWLLFVRIWFSKKLESYHDLITAGLFVLGVFAGFAGFLDRPPALTDAGERVPFWQHVFDAVHSTLQLVVLNVDHEKSHGLFLGFARVALPLSAARAAFALLGTAFSQWRLRVRLSLPDVKVLVLGCGKTAQLFAEHAGLRGNAVIGVDRRTTSNLSKFRILVADLKEAATLNKLGLRWAKHIIICTGDDVLDVDLARRIVLYGVPPMTRFSVSAETAAVPRACALDPVLKPYYDNGKLDFFSIAHTVARSLLIAHPPHTLPRRPEHPAFAPDEINVCHIAIYGDGPLIDELTAQAARALVYSLTSPLQVTVLVPDAPTRADKFFARFPALAPLQTLPNHQDEWIYGHHRPLAKIDFVESSSEQINALALRRTEGLRAVYCVGRSDAEARLLAANVIKAGKSSEGTRCPPIVVCLEEASGTASFPELPEGERELLTAFCFGNWWADRLKDAKAADVALTLPDEVSDELATQLSASYEHTKATKPKTWAEQAHHVKWFNRYAADHNSAVKYTLLGLSPEATDAEVTARANESLAWLTKLEHRRYACERLTDGWLRSSSDAARDYALNPTLKPHSELERSEIEKDERIVNNLRPARKRA